jgi:uncharacterized membrane protein YciS (DUF1049 family)
VDQHYTLRITWLQHKIGTYIAINTYANNEQCYLFCEVLCTSNYNVSHVISILNAKLCVCNSEIWHTWAWGENLSLWEWYRHRYETRTSTRTKSTVSGRDRNLNTRRRRENAEHRPGWNRRRLEFTFLLKIKRSHPGSGRDLRFLVFRRVSCPREFDKF